MTVPEGGAGDLDAALVAALASVAGGPLPSGRTELRDRVAAALRAELGWRRAVIPGDRLPGGDPDGPDAVEFDIGVRGRFAGRVHAAVGCAVHGGGVPDPEVLRALVTAAAAVRIRAQEGYVVVATAAGGRGAGATGPVLPGLPDGVRALASLLGDAPPAGTPAGLRVPARLGVVPVARSPVAGGGTLWAGRVLAEGGEIRL